MMQKARKVAAKIVGGGWGKCSHLASYRVKHKGGGVCVRSWRRMVPHKNVINFI